MSDSNTFGYGYQGPSDAASDYNALTFVINQILGRIRTCVLVKVVTAPYGGGGLAPVGFIDAMPLVNMVDGLGNSMPHGTVYTLPYFRLQGGSTGAVICDPAVGDIGAAIICDRDISSAKQNRGQANPGSWRRFNLADGLYLGGFLNGTPSSYVQFDGLGNMNIVAPSSNTITISAGKLILHGVNELTYDAGGTGVKYTPSLITSYTEGVEESTVPPDPPGPLE